jgi:hypothetical protein
MNHTVSDCIGVRQPGKRRDHCVGVNPAIGQLQIVACENRQRAIEHAQPERTRAGIGDKDTHADNDTCGLDRVAQRGRSSDLDPASTFGSSRS